MKCGCVSVGGAVMPDCAIGASFVAAADARCLFALFTSPVNSISSASAPLFAADVASVSAVDAWSVS